MYHALMVAGPLRWTPRALVLVAVVALAGCSTYQASAPEAAVPAKKIRMHFETPRTLSIASSSGDTLSVEDVVELEGEVLEQLADTLVVDASRVRRGSGSSTRFGDGSFVRIPAQALEVKQLSGGRTVLLVLGILAGVVLVIAATYEPDIDYSEVDKSSGGK